MTQKEPKIVFDCSGARGVVTVDITCPLHDTTHVPGLPPAPIRCPPSQEVKMGDSCNGDEGNEYRRKSIRTLKSLFKSVSLPPPPNHHPIACTQKHPACFSSHPFLLNGALLFRFATLSLRGISVSSDSEILAEVAAELIRNHHPSCGPGCCGVESNKL